MAYNAIHHTNHTAQISINPSLKSASSIRSAVRHNTRVGKEGRGAHIDERRQFMNKDLLGGKSQDEIYLNLINRISGKQYTKDTVPIYGEDDVYYADGKKLKASKNRENDRYDRVLAFEIETMYPGDMIWSKFDENGRVVPLSEDAIVDVAEIAVEGKVVVDPLGNPILDDNGNQMIGKGYFKMPLNQDEFEEWCKATIEFAQDRFGENNVVSAQLHMDEQTPHIHMICTPLVEDKNGFERLNYYEMLGKDSIFGNLQDEYANAVSYIGYKRGERNSQRIHSITTKEYKTRLAKEMSKEMPDTIEKSHNMIRDLRVRNFDLEERMNSIKVSANKFQKMRNKLDDIKKENEELKEQVQKQAYILQQQKERIMIEENRKMCIEEGLKIYGDKKVVDAYEKMEEQFLQRGFEHRRSLGFTNEQLRYWEDINHDDINDQTQNIKTNHEK